MESSKSNTNYYVNKITTKDSEITINIKRMKNPAYLLEKLYLLRLNDKLSDDEKNQEMKKIVSDYMRWSNWMEQGILYQLICPAKLIRLNVQRQI